MTIEDTQTLDGAGIDEDTNETVLVISDHLSWQNEGEHFTLLEKKLSSYIDFVRSGQIYEVLPSSRGLPIRIRLIHEHAPTSSALAFLRAAQKQLAEIGFNFSHQSLPEGY